MLEEVDTKTIYWHFINKFSQRPTSELKWREKAQLDISEEEWAFIYKLPFSLVRDTRIQMFQYKITHRILACKRNLFLWKIEPNDLCSICSQQVDTIEHHLVTCNKVANFWAQVFNWLKASLKVSFPVGTYERLFGLPNDTNDILINQVNYILMMARYYIYKMKQQGKDFELFLFLLDCKFNLHTEYEIRAASSGFDKFKKGWHNLIELFLDNSS